MKRANIETIARKLAGEKGYTITEAKNIVQTVMNIVKNELVENGDILFTGIFSLKVVERGERKVMDFTTGKPKTIPAMKTVKIKLSEEFKNELNK